MMTDVRLELSDLSLLTVLVAHFVVGHCACCQETGMPLLLQVCQSLQAFDKSPPTYTSAQGRHNLLQRMIARAEHAAGIMTGQPPSLGPIADSYPALQSPTRTGQRC
jgi:hypothetical protein